MNRDEHRAKALELYGLANAIDTPAHPLRLAILAEAQLNATLAITAPEPPAVLDPTPNTPRKRAAAKTVAESKETTK